MFIELLSLLIFTFVIAVVVVVYIWLIHKAGEDYFND